MTHQADFVGCQYQGMEVYYDTQRHWYSLDDAPLRIPQDLVVIRDRDGIRPGQKIIVRSLNGYSLAEVKQFHDGQLYWISGDLMGNLEYGQDDRRCWITTCLGDWRQIAYANFV